MEIKIEKFDDFGRGICYIDNKVTFVPNAIPNDLVEIKITKEFMSLNEEERRKYLANAFSIDYCLKLGLASFKIIPHKKYFQPVNELISFKDKEEMDKFLNLV